MKNHSEGLGAVQRQCPTRADEREVLIAQTIPVERCQGRQRAHYHKCFTCVHKGASAATPPPAAVLNGHNGHAKNGAAKNGAQNGHAVRLAKSKKAPAVPAVPAVPTVKDAPA